MAGEEWARRLLSRELGRTVVLHDDGSAPGMYDLRVGPADAPELAVECTGAVDPVLTETLNVAAVEGAWSLAIAGDWWVGIAATARIKAIKKRIESLLGRCEARGLHQLRTDFRLQWCDPVLFEELASLQITAARCYRLPGSGKVHLIPDGIGGVVDSAGAAVPQWIGAFLRERGRQDVLRKLQASRAMERHAFILVAYGGAPWVVESYLAGELDQVPDEAPDLPPPVTAVWIVWGRRRKGIRWIGSSWQLFEARADEEG